MIHVALDTSVLRRDPRRAGRAFQRLADLVRGGHLQIHVPDIVRREFNTGVEVEYRRLLAEVRRPARLLRGFPVPADVERLLGGLVDATDELTATLARHSEVEFETWLRDLNVALAPVRSHHAERVIEAYFAGGAGFRRSKHRDDFPDAFVVQALGDIHDQIRVILHVVSLDEGLRVHCSHMTMAVYSSLEEFLTSDVCAPFLREELSADTVRKLATAGWEKTDSLRFLLRAALHNELLGARVSVNRDAPNATIVAVRDLISADFAPELEFVGNGTVSARFEARIAGRADTDPEPEVLDRSGRQGIATLELETILKVSGRVAIHVDPAALATAGNKQPDLLRVLTGASIDGLSDLTIEIPPRG